MFLLVNERAGRQLSSRSIFRVPYPRFKKNSNALAITLVLQESVGRGICLLSAEPTAHLPLITYKPLLNSEQTRELSTGCVVVVAIEMFTAYDSLIC